MKRAFLSIAVAVALQSGTSFAQEQPQFRQAAIQHTHGPRMASPEQVLMAGAKYQQMLLESMMAIAEIIESPEQMREYLQAVAEEGRAGLIDAAAQCNEYYSTEEFQARAQRCIDQEMISLTVVETLAEIEFTQAEVDRFRVNIAEVARQRTELNDVIVSGISESLRQSSRAPLDEALRSNSNHAASLVRCTAHAVQPIIAARAEARQVLASVPHP